MQTTSGAPPTARIVYVGGADHERTALTINFGDAGFELVSHEDSRRSDIGLIDLRGRLLSSKKAQSIASLLKRTSPESIILLIIDPYIDETARKALRRHGELVTMNTAPDGVIERCRQLLRLRNVAEETGERLKSLATLNRLTDFPPISAPSTPFRVLIAGKAGPPALTAVNALRPITEQCVCVFSAGQALRALEISNFDSAIFFTDGEADPLMSLARSLRRHPRYASLPIIFPHGDPDDTRAFTKRGASDFLLIEHLAADLSPIIQIATKRARLLKTMRQFLQACEGDGVRDIASGAFTSTFLSEHGARLCSRADQSCRPIALAALKIHTQSTELNLPEPGRRALHQAARLINRVIRAEDVVARVATDTFFVLMPATTEKDGARAVQRIKGVLESSVFRSTGTDLLYGIRVTVAACARPEGFCIEESVALALAELRENDATQLTGAI